MRGLLTWISLGLFQLLFGKPPEAPDLEGQRPQDLDSWDADDPAGSLEVLFRAYVVTGIGAAISWYFVRRKAKRAIGYVVRLAAVLSAGFGVLIPMLSELVRNDTGPVISPGWASIALLVGAGLVWIDRFLDGTSGWLRYLEAALTLSQLRDASVLSWKELESKRTNPMTPKQIQEAFEFIRDSNTQLNNIVIAETTQWQEQFRSSLTQLDTLVKSRLKRSEQELEAETARRQAEEAKREQEEAAASRTGSLEVIVESADPIESCDTTIASADQSFGPQNGSSVSFLGLAPGPWTVTVEGSRKDGANSVGFRQVRVVEIQADEVERFRIAVS